MIRSTLLLAVLPVVPCSAATLLHVGRIIDSVGNEPLIERTVVVDGSKISSIERGYRAAAAGDTVVDLRNATLMAGWTDMHVHLTSEYRRGIELERFTTDPPDVAIDAVVYAHRTLLSGFTSVRDVGDAFRASISLRDAVNAGKVPGPRIYAAGMAIATTGGHTDPTNGWARHLGGSRGPLDGVINGPTEAAQAVRQCYKDGCDVVKIAVTGGVMSIARNASNPQFSDQEIRAVVATARDYGFTVAAHAHGAEGVKRAVRAGVDSIEHGSFMDDEAMALMKQAGTWLVPTLSAGRWVTDRSAEENFLPAIVRPKAALAGPQNQATFSKAYRFGVRILFGTDSGLTAHGENAREFEYMVEGGMPALEAIKSATISPARFLGVDDRLGTVQSGKIADLVAVDGDPLTDIRVMRRVVFVMKGGTTYKSP